MEKNNGLIYNFIKSEYTDPCSFPTLELPKIVYSITQNDKNLAIKSIILRKKRKREYDRILFHQDQKIKSKEEEKELKKDRKGFINYLSMKYKKQFPPELLDKSNKIKVQQAREYSYLEIFQQLDEKYSKKATKKELKVEEKKKEVKEDKKQKKTKKNKEEEEENQKKNEKEESVQDMFELEDEVEEYELDGSGGYDDDD